MGYLSVAKYHSRTTMKSSVGNYYSKTIMRYQWLTITVRQ